MYRPNMCCEVEPEKEWKMSPIEIEREAINRWGTEKQLFMVFEEMSELQKEICKFIRGKNNKIAIAEEMADVQIMLEQLQIMCGIQNADIAHHYEMKMDRLQRRLIKR